MMKVKVRSVIRLHEGWKLAGSGRSEEDQAAHYMGGENKRFSYKEGPKKAEVVLAVHVGVDHDVNWLEQEIHIYNS